MKDIFEIIYYVGTPFIALISVLLAWKTSSKEYNKIYLKERYEKVIFPMFSIMENHLYKKDIDDEVLNALNDCKLIIEKNRMIVGGKLLYVFSCPYTKDNFQVLSKLIEKEYDYCCSALGIPLRTLDYKVGIFKTRNLRLFILFMTKISAPGLAFFCFIIYLFILIINLIK